jgi:hypothetical protein
MRLGEKVECARLERLDRHRHVAMSRQHDDGCRRPELSHRPEKREAVLAGHANIRQDDIDVVGREAGQCFRGGGRQRRREAGQCQPLANRFGDHLVVVDNQDAGSFLCFVELVHG